MVMLVYRKAVDIYAFVLKPPPEILKFISVFTLIVSGFVDRLSSANHDSFLLFYIILCLLFLFLILIALGSMLRTMLLLVIMVICVVSDFNKNRPLLFFIIQLKALSSLN